MTESPKDWTRLQPKPGDVILHCGHLDAGVIHEWLMVAHDDGVKFQRLDGSMGEARWMSLCKSRCFPVHQETGRLLIRGDFVWPNDGKGPIIFRPQGP